MKRFAVLAISGFVTVIGTSGCGGDKTQMLNLVGRSAGNTSLNGTASAGDRISISEQLTRNGQPYGTDRGICTANTETTANCAVTLMLPGGTVVVQGPVNLSAKKSTLAVSEGTGKYLETSGVADVDNSQGNETRLTLHLKPY